VKQKEGKVGGVCVVEGSRRLGSKNEGKREVYVSVGRSVGLSVCDYVGLSVCGCMGGDPL
jgi:hypothetical protein